MKKLFIYLLIAASFNISANTGRKKYKSFEKPIFLIGYFGVSLLNMRRVDLNNDYLICSVDPAMDGVRVSDLFSIRGDAQIADSETYLVETKREVFLGKIKKSFLSDDCIKPIQEGAYRDVATFWKKMKHFSLIIEKRIQILRETIEEYKISYLKDMDSNIMDNIKKVTLDLKEIFIFFRSDLGLDYGIYQFDHNFMKNPRLSKDVNQILSKIDLSILELYKDSFFDIYSYDNEKFVRDLYFNNEEIKALKIELENYLPGDQKRLDLCTKLNNIYKKYHYENKKCLK